MSAIRLGNIVIGYFMSEDGDIQTSYSVEGDIPVVTQLGLLSMAQDTVFRSV